MLKNGHLELNRGPQWFAVYTQSRQEKCLAKYFDQRAIECYLPLYRSARRWKDGSRVSLELPLFPGYIFVHIQRHERVRVLELPGVVRIVCGTGGELLSLPDTAVDALRGGLAEHAVQPHPFLGVGERARIRYGALAGMEGVVVRYKGSLRVVLTLELIMRSIAVEVSCEDLEPVESRYDLEYRVSA